MFLNYNIPDMDKPNEQLTPNDIAVAGDMQNTIANIQQPIATNMEMPVPAATQSGGQELQEGE